MAISWINEHLAPINTEGPISDIMLGVETLLNEVDQLIAGGESNLETNAENMVVRANAMNASFPSIANDCGKCVEKLNEWSENDKNVESNATHPNAVLRNLVAVKNRVEKEHEKLKQADNWSLCETEIEQAFDRGDLNAVPSKLQTLQNALVECEQFHDYENKAMYVEGVKNRMEARYSPDIIQAFTTGDCDASCEFVKLFDLMNRKAQLLEYYVDCEKRVTYAEWQRIASECEKLENTLEETYRLLQSRWRKQVTWCEKIFNTSSVAAVDLANRVTSEVLIAANQTLCNMIDESVSKEGAESDGIGQIGLLLKLCRITRSFYNGICSTNSLLSDKNTTLIGTIFVPYKKYINHFEDVLLASWERTLARELVLPDNVAESFDYLNRVSEIVCNLSKEGIAPCASLTGSCAFSDLRAAIQKIFWKHVASYERTAESVIEKAKNCEDLTALRECFRLEECLANLMFRIGDVDSQLKIELRKNRNDAINFGKIFLDEIKFSELTRFLEQVDDSANNEKIHFLQDVIESVESIIGDVHKASLAMIAKPITAQLRRVTQIWGRKFDERLAALPDYSFSPLEYITKIGEYLLTLPQYLEPYLLTPNESLSIALLGVLKPDVYDRSLLVLRSHPADLLDNIKKRASDLTFVHKFMEDIVRATCKEYLAIILNIRNELDNAACKQLAADIDYLSNVLEELDFKLSKSLSYVPRLLRSPSNDYYKHSEGCPPNIVAAIRQMRCIPPISR